MNISNMDGNEILLESGNENWELFGFNIHTYIHNIIYVDVMIAPYSQCFCVQALITQ